MFFNILLDVFYVFLTYFLVLSNEGITVFLLTEFALNSHDSILSLQETAYKQAVCFACFTTCKTTRLGRQKRQNMRCRFCDFWRAESLRFADNIETQITMPVKKLLLFLHVWRRRWNRCKLGWRWWYNTHTTRHWRHSWISKLRWTSASSFFIL